MPTAQYRCLTKEIMFITQTSLLTSVKITLLLIYCQWSTKLNWYETVRNSITYVRLVIASTPFTCAGNLIRLTHYSTVHSKCATSVLIVVTSLWSWLANYDHVIKGTAVNMFDGCASKIPTQTLQLVETYSTRANTMLTVHRQLASKWSLHRHCNSSWDVETHSTRSYVTVHRQLASDSVLQAPVHSE